jgi:hypothetical protein
MKILSIDPGIKNLAFCLFERIENINGINGINGENKYIIKKWDTINLSEEKKEILCQTKGCTKPAKFCSQCIQTQPQSLYFCLKHAKEKIKDSKDSLQIPKREQQMSFIKKQKIQELQNIANQYNIHFLELIPFLMFLLLPTRIMLSHVNTVKRYGQRKHRLLLI